MSNKSTNYTKKNANIYQKPKQQGFIPIQPKKKKQWDKTHTIVFILILFWSIGSILGTIGFINTCSKNTTASNVAYADDTSSGITGLSFNFQTVPLNCYPNGFYTVGNSSRPAMYQDFVNLGATNYIFNLSFNNGLPSSSSVSFKDDNYLNGNQTAVVYSETNTIPNLFFNVGKVDGAYINRTLFNYLDDITTYRFTLWHFSKYKNAFTQTGLYVTTSMFRLYFYVPEDNPITSLNFYKVDIYSADGDIAYNNQSMLGSKFYYYKYTNDLEQSFYLYFPFYVEDNTYQSFRYTRFLVSNLVDNTIYQTGYDLGYDSGFNKGKEIGYQDGLDRGKDIGYYDGLADGIQQGSSGDYTFLGLMSAVIDAPVQAISGLLNFTILGVDMSDFFFGILTLCLFIAVAKVVVKSVV